MSDIMQEDRTYKFSELSDRAKERAREWYRDGNMHDNWWEFIYDDFETVAKCLGIYLDTKTVKLVGGGTRQDPCIWFQLNYSQGDGAAFDGRHSWEKGQDFVKLIKDHAPNDEELCAMAERLMGLQVKTGGEFECTIRSHRDTSITVQSNAGDFENEDACDIEDDASVIFNDLAGWLHTQLEKECDHLNSDEVVDESIEANEYEFDEDGNLA